MLLGEKQGARTSEVVETPERAWSPCPFWRYCQGWWDGAWQDVGGRKGMAGVCPGCT